MSLPATGSRNQHEHAAPRWPGPKGQGKENLPKNMKHKAKNTKVLLWEEHRLGASQGLRMDIADLPRDAAYVGANPAGPISWAELIKGTEQPIQP